MITNSSRIDFFSIQFSSVRFAVRFSSPVLCEKPSEDDPEENMQLEGEDPFST